VAFVLVAEDETELAATLASVLRGAGHEVTTTANGDEALRLARGRAPDLLISDWALEGSIDGIALIEAVRAGQPQVRAILMTGYPSARLRSWAAAGGCAGLLEKPFPLAELRALVTRTLG
jgi:two-component system response regulator FlrC